MAARPPAARRAGHRPRLLLARQGAGRREHRSVFPTANFNVVTPVSFDKPTPISPINNSQVSSQSPDFKWGDAPRQARRSKSATSSRSPRGDTFRESPPSGPTPSSPVRPAWRRAPHCLPACRSSGTCARSRAASWDRGPTRRSSGHRRSCQRQRHADGRRRASNCVAQPTALTVVQCERAKCVSTMSASQTLTFPAHGRERPERERRRRRRTVRHPAEAWRRAAATRATSSVPDRARLRGSGTSSAIRTARRRAGADRAPTRTSAWTPATFSSRDAGTLPRPHQQERPALTSGPISNPTNI